MTLPIVILAGGLATRLGNMSHDIPKSLIKVGDKPFIEWQIENLKRNQINDILICIGHLGHKITEYLGSGKNFGVKIEYSEDGPSKLGTGGALTKALAKLPDEFMVTYGDSYLLGNFQDMYNHYSETKAKAMMSIYRNTDPRYVNNCMYDGGVIEHYSKNYNAPIMNSIDYGLLIFKKNLFENHQNDKFVELGTICESLSERRLLMGYEFKEKFYEIGSKSGIEDLEEFLNSSSP